MLRFGTLGPPHRQEPTREAIRLAAARRNGWPQLNRADLVYYRFGTVEHAPSSNLFRLHQGELTDAVGAVAFFEDAFGAIKFLEGPPAGSPKTVDEREQRRAEREQLRNAPKPRRPATRR